MSEVVTEENKLRNEREVTRSNSEKLLEVLGELFPTWGCQTIPGENLENFGPEYSTRIHFLHDNPLHSEFSADTLVDEKALPLMLLHSVLLYLSVSEAELDWAKFPRLYYNLEGVERLLVVYRAWVRLNSSDSEYERINGLVTSCFV